MYFENGRCEKCPGFHWALRPPGGSCCPWWPSRYGRSFRLYGEPAAGPAHLFASHAHGVCNWLVPSAGPTPFCPACPLDRTIPDLLSHPGYLRPLVQPGKSRQAPLGVQPAVPAPAAAGEQKRVPERRPAIRLQGRRGHQRQPARAHGPR
ncbi:MAG: zinc-ribbon domain-containing protein [Hymenobacter sp.]